MYYISIKTNGGKLLITFENNYYKLNDSIISEKELIELIIKNYKTNCFVEIIEEQNEEIYWSDDFYAENWTLENIKKLEYNIEWKV